MVSSETISGNAFQPVTPHGETIAFLWHDDPESRSTRTIHSVSNSYVSVFAYKAAFLKDIGVLLGFNETRATGKVSA